MSKSSQPSLFLIASASCGKRCSILMRDCLDSALVSQSHRAARIGSGQTVALHVRMMITKLSNRLTCTSSDF